MLSAICYMTNESVFFYKIEKDDIFLQIRNNRYYEEVH